MVCEICQRINLVYEKCYDMIGQIEWYLYPVEIQRLLPLIIMVAQRPIQIVYFGSGTCDRELIKKVPACSLFPIYNISMDNRYLCIDFLFFFIFLDYQNCLFIFHGAS